MRGDLSIVRIYELALGNFRLHGNVNKEGVREGWRNTRALQRTWVDNTVWVRWDLLFERRREGSWREKNGA